MFIFGILAVLGGWCLPRGLRIIGRITSDLHQWACNHTRDLCDAEEFTCKGLNPAPVVSECNSSETNNNCTCMCYGWLRNSLSDILFVLKWNKLRVSLHLWYLYCALDMSKLLKPNFLTALRCKEREDEKSPETNLLPHSILPGWLRKWQGNQTAN